MRIFYFINNSRFRKTQKRSGAQQGTLVSPARWTRGCQRAPTR